MTTATLNDQTGRKKRAEPSAEAKAAAELVRAVAQRVRSRCSTGLRKPQASRATVLMTRLVPSEPALVMPVRMNTRIWGHQAYTVVARRSSSGRSALAQRW